MKAIDYIVLVLVIIGAINWGLVGFFGLDLVAFLFGSMSVLSRIIYAVIGICGLYAISFCGRINNHIRTRLRQSKSPRSNAFTNNSAVATLVARGML